VTHNPGLGGPPAGPVVQRAAQQSAPASEQHGPTRGPGHPAPAPAPVQRDVAAGVRAEAPATTADAGTRTTPADAGTQTEPGEIDIEALISGFTRRHLDTLARRLHGSLQRLSRDDLRHSRERSGQWRDGRR
jgi:syndecan 1